MQKVQEEKQGRKNVNIDSFVYAHVHIMLSIFFKTIFVQKVEWGGLIRKKFQYISSIAILALKGINGKCFQDSYLLHLLETFKCKTKNHNSVTVMHFDQYMTVPT